jgi:hypothetical protein
MAGASYATLSAVGLAEMESEVMTAMVVEFNSCYPKGSLGSVARKNGSVQYSCAATAIAAG